MNSEEKLNEILKLYKYRSYDNNRLTGEDTLNIIKNIRFKELLTEYRLMQNDLYDIFKIINED